MPGRAHRSRARRRPPAAVPTLCDRSGPPEARSRHRTRRSRCLVNPEDQTSLSLLLRFLYNQGTWIIARKLYFFLFWLLSCRADAKSASVGVRGPQAPEKLLFVGHPGGRVL